MTLSVKGMAAACGLLWGAAVLLLGIGNQLFPGYGRAVLDLAASIYPGFDPAGGFGAVIVGALYSVVDGAVGGAVFAWLYNRAAGRPT